ncbi:MAG: methylmalonyl Co-A mutase-associated GTPase MeaB [Bacteroidetes bacterium]|nr:methylmalonyl Co-A mutase-associated GTPase MeaB [Bacteroidota bacterium]
MNSQQLKQLIEQGNIRGLAKGITEVENQTEIGRSLLASLELKKPVPVIGFTGPPGAGKSTLINAFTEYLVNKNFKVGILAVDPTSPFNKGSLLGDRVRMSHHFLNPLVYIRSLATRGSLGGLSPRAFEVIHLMQAAGFDYILIETVGVGQSEVEICGLADTTVLVLVPEAGDEVQTLKSGIMEIADVYVVNKADREGASLFVKNLQMLVHEKAPDTWQTPIVKTVASSGIGIDELFDAVNKHQKSPILNEKKSYILMEKILTIIKEERTRDLNLTAIYDDLKHAQAHIDFNIYRFVKKYI